MPEHLQIPFQIYASKQELPEDEQVLMLQALEASQKAYAPYSEFYVGCALLLASGEVILGNNQENAAFPSGLCAERTALFFAGSQGKGKDIRKIAIRAWSNNKLIEEPVTPCGACRQVIVEYERQSDLDIAVIMQGAAGKVLRLLGARKTLLPFSFDIEF